MNKLLFTYRLLKHLSILLFISIPLQATSIIVVPLVLLYIGYDPKFPAWLKWFDSADHWIGRNTETYDHVIAEGFWSRWAWLSLRNPCNYFGYTVLGFKVIDRISLIDHGVRGHMHWSTWNVDGKLYYEYDMERPWSATKCFRMRIGYKLGNIGSTNIGDWCQGVFRIQPYVDL